MVLFGVEAHVEHGAHSSVRWSLFFYSQNLWACLQFLQIVSFRAVVLLERCLEAKSFVNWMRLSCGAEVVLAWDLIVLRPWVQKGLLRCEHQTSLLFGKVRFWVLIFVSFTACTTPTSTAVSHSIFVFKWIRLVDVLLDSEADVQTLFILIVLRL